MRKHRPAPLPGRTVAVLVAAALAAACAGVPSAGPGRLTTLPAPSAAEEGRARVFPDFVAVVTTGEDTLRSLAAEFLGDQGKDWVVAEYNGIESVKPGQQLVIPLGLFKRGGLTPAGYQTVVVLSYHNFSESKTDKMTITREAFELQMKYLEEHGYRVIGLPEFLDFLDFRADIPAKSVVITIDDGWRGVYDVAYPVLRARGFPATLFLYSDMITGSSKTLSWDLVGELAREGLDIQNHTRTHRNMAEVGEKESLDDYAAAVLGEIDWTAGLIEQRTGIRSEALAYPFGDTNPYVIACLMNRGYRAAFTVIRGSTPFFASRYRLNRSMIFGDYSIEQFKKNLGTFERMDLR